MTNSEIMQLGVKSADVYYRALAAKKGGADRISVSNISAENNGNYTLSLSKKLFSPDDVYLEIKGIEYKSGQIYIVDYDDDYLRLTVRPASGYISVFEFIKPSDIFVISDLKFLIKRVENWYQSNGDKIKLPAENVFKNVDFSSLPNNLSQEQAQAIKNIFSYPFTYIWGAPGTGKTKAVLANAIMLYVKRHCRVLVVAPTNNALEQSFYGILPILEGIGFPLKKVLRLGTPSKQFAKRYPECCETIGKEMQIKKMADQVAFCKKRLDLVCFKRKYDVLVNNIFPLITDIEEYFLELTDNKSSSDYLLSEIRIRTQAVEYLQNDIHALSLEIEKIEKSINQYSSFFKKIIFGGKINELTQSKEQRLSLFLKNRETLLGLTKEQSDLKEQHAYFESAQQELYQKISESYSAIQQESSISEKLSKIAKSFNVNAIDKMKSAFYQRKCEAEERLQSEPPIQESETEEYYTNRIKELTNEIKLLQSGVAARLRNCQVVGVTSDSFLSRYSDFSDESPAYKVDHIFLDEAGYCSLIKGAALLSLKCPVTFLGDHMQLPPVCEMDDKEFEDNNDFSSAFLWAQSSLAAEMLFDGDFSENLKLYKDKLPPDFIKLKKSDLTATYRFGDKLCNILDTYVYKNGIHSADDNKEFIIEVLHAKKMPGNKKRQSKEEAHAILQWLNFMQPKDFAILTPYKNQIEYLKEILPREQRIFTVHASQGREWDTVILSVVDTSNKYYVNSKLPIGLRLLNTAISRTKRRLVIVCDTDYWKDSGKQLVAKLIETKTR